DELLTTRIGPPGPRSGSSGDEARDWSVFGTASSAIPAISVTSKPRTPPMSTAAIEDTWLSGSSAFRLPDIARMAITANTTLARAALVMSSTPTATSPVFAPGGRPAPGSKNLSSRQLDEFPGKTAETVRQSDFAVQHADRSLSGG